jgi:methylated-DNA-[protein]-cysteine S-methyltransferase
VNENPKNYDNDAIKDSDAYKLLLEIPPGKVSTYGDIAKALGKPLSSREIGRILGRNPNPIKVPCHRVMMSDGTVGGYIFGRDRKKELLVKEGISFSHDTVNNFKEVRFHPKNKFAERKRFQNAKRKAANLETKTLAVSCQIWSTITRLDCSDLHLDGLTCSPKACLHLRILTCIRSFVLYHCTWVN